MSLTLVANLPLVLLISVAICHRCQQHKGNCWQNLPLVSLIPAAICHRCNWHWLQICHRCRWHRWFTLTCEYLREFWKKFEMVIIRGLGEGDSWKKPEAKNLVTLFPLTAFQICLKHRTPDCRDRVILRMRTWKCVRQNNALIGQSMVRAPGPYWLPNSYNSKDISKLSHSM